MHAMLVDLAALEAAPVAQTPYSHVIVPHFIKPESLAAIEKDYSAIDKPGSFPLPALRYSVKFKQLIAEITSLEMAHSRTVVTA